MTTPRSHDFNITIATLPTTLTILIFLKTHYNWKILQVGKLSWNSLTNDLNKTGTEFAIIVTQKT